MQTCSYLQGVPWGRPQVPTDTSIANTAGLVRQRRTCSAGEKKTRLSAGMNTYGCGIPVREPA